MSARRPTDAGADAPSGPAAATGVSADTDAATNGPAVNNSSNAGACPAATAGPAAAELVADYNRARAELTAPGGPFGWTVTEVRGVPTRVFDRAPANMRAVWEKAVGRGSDDYLIYGDERYSYADAAAVVRALAGYLRDEHGVGAGDRVAIAMRNYPEWVLAHWAITATGAATVALNAWWTAPELHFALADSSPTVLILDGERLQLLTADARAEADACAASVGAETAAGAAADSDTTVVAAADAGAGAGADSDAHAEAGAEAGSDVVATTGSKAEAGAGLPPLVVTRHDGARPLGVRACRWDDVADPAGAPDDLPAAAIHPDDDVCIFYTSGTTAHPKGARTTHRNAVHNLLHINFVSKCGDAARARRLAAHATQGDPQPQPTDEAAPSGETQQPQSPALEPPQPPSSGEAPQRQAPEEPEPNVEPKPQSQSTALLPVPLFHATGCTCVLHPATAAGARLVLMHHWDPAEALRIIERERVTNITGVPTMARELLTHPDWAQRDTSSLRSLGGGGAAIQPDLVARIDTSLARGRPNTGYGLTEVTGLAAGISNEFYLAKPTSVGPVAPTMEARVVDADGNDLATGQPGELWLRGPNVIKGYLNDPDATAAAICDGWLRTGDIAEIDADGWIHIKDRAKDVVIRGGENVHCGEVEAALHELDSVADVAVFGIPDGRLGEEVAAAVVPAPGATLTTADLTEHLTGRLARFKHPRHVWFLNGPLPRNAAGKTLKRQLRNQLHPAP